MSNVNTNKLTRKRGGRETPWRLPLERLDISIPTPEDLHLMSLFRCISRTHKPRSPNIKYIIMVIQGSVWVTLALSLALGCFFRLLGASCSSDQCIRFSSKSRSRTERRAVPHEDERNREECERKEAEERNAPICAEVTDDGICDHGEDRCNYRSREGI